MFTYYDWNSTLAYNAETTLVVGARGIGKTFGLRCQAVRDWIKTRSSFCEIVRYKNRVEGEKRIQRDYFTRVGRMYPGYVFKTEGTRAYIAKKPKDENKEPAWNCFGYFAAMTEYQNLKNATFPDAYQREGVRRFIMDEFIIERDLARQYKTYIPGEIDIVASIIDSISRERPGEDPLVAPRLYLLANAGDLVNPWFARYGITKRPEPGYTWLDPEKRALLHYAVGGDYGSAKMEGTVAGRLSGDSVYSEMANKSEFFTLDESLFSKAPKGARFSFGFYFYGEPFGVWLDDKGGYYYVNSSIPKGELKEPVYALTKDDSSPNYIQATKAQKQLRGFAEMYYYDCIRYESQAKRESFIEALSLYGIR